MITHYLHSQLSSPQRGISAFASYGDDDPTTFERSLFGSGTAEVFAAESGGAFSPPILLSNKLKWSIYLQNDPRQSSAEVGVPLLNSPARPPFGILSMTSREASLRLFFGLVDLEWISNDAHFLGCGKKLDCDLKQTAEATFQVTGFRLGRHETE